MKLSHEMCNQFFEKLDIETKQLIICFVGELKEATEQRPAWPKDKIHAAAIVAEESGELVRAALQYKYEKGQYYQMHREAIQTGAMVLRFLLNAPDLKIKS